MRIPAPGQQRAGSTRTLLSGADGSVVKRSVLPGGLRVVSELVPAARSASVGFWVGVGSRDESAKSAGASHFLEHLLFKGTDRRSPFDISAAIESVGGDINAFTTAECTCFHARVLADDLPLAIDVLADMIINSKVTAEDVDLERGVVLEELAMYEDDFADVAQQSFSARAYGSSPLATPVIGTSQSLRAMPRSTVWRHYRSNYRPCDVVIAAAGAVDHKRLVTEVRKATGGWMGDPAALPTATRAARARAHRQRAVVGTAVIKRTTEQAHVVIGVPGLARTDDRRWPLAVLDVALGGGMSSRLFQEVREKRSLVYTVQTFRSMQSDAGLFGVYVGTAPDKAELTMQVVRSVLADVAANGISEAEMTRAKGHLRGASVMKSEDPDSRMSRLGEAELLSGNLLSLDDVIAKIDAVTNDDVASIARDLLGAEQTIAVVGPYEQDQSFSQDIVDLSEGGAVQPAPAGKKDKTERLGKNKSAGKGKKPAGLKDKS
ncbi:MAG: pitrilysin family protein [Actinomycetes bacterium]